MDLSEIDPLYVVVPFAAVVIVLLLRKRNRQLKALRRFADENGYQFIPASRFGSMGGSSWKYTLDGRYDDVWFRKYADFYPFDSTQSQKVWDQLVKEEDGATWRVFQFDSHRDSEGTWKRTMFWICTVELPMDLPALQVRPVGFLDKVGGLFGRGDIQTGSGEFDDKFHVSGENEAFARDFLDSGMKRFLIELGPFRWHLRGPHAMLVWPHSYDGKDVELMLFALKRFMRQIPEPVMCQYPGS